MVIATSNRLLPILAGVVVLMLGFVTIKSCSNISDNQVVMESVPQAPMPDADTPADTIKTLTANVAAMTAEVEALRQGNTKLHNENRQLLTNRAQIEKNVTTRVKRDLLSREHDQEVRQQKDSSVLSSLTARMDVLSQSLSIMKPTQGAGDIPVGLGYDGTPPVAKLVWINPLAFLRGKGLGHGNRFNKSDNRDQEGR